MQEYATKENDLGRLSIYYDEHAESTRTTWDNLCTMTCSHRSYNLGDEQAKNTEDYSNWEEWLEHEILEPAGGKTNVVFLPLYLYDHSDLSISTGSFDCRWDSGQVGWIYATKDTFRKETGYTENELFAKDKHRVPLIGEGIKVKGYEDKGFGKVIAFLDNLLVVDFDYNRHKECEKPKMIITLDRIAEVRSNKAEEMMRNEVEIYNEYLQGNVFGFILEEKIYRTPCDPYPSCDLCDQCPEYDLIEKDSCWGFYGNDFKTNGMLEYLPKEYESLLGV